MGTAGLAPSGAPTADPLTARLSLSVAHGAPWTQVNGSRVDGYRMVHTGMFGVSASSGAPTADPLMARLSLSVAHGAPWTQVNGSRVDGYRMVHTGMFGVSASLRRSSSWPGARTAYLCDGAVPSVWRSRVLIRAQGRMLSQIDAQYLRTPRVAKRVRIRCTTRQASTAISR